MVRSVRQQDGWTAVDDRTVAGYAQDIGLRLYRTAAGPLPRELPGVLYFHGGGFTTGSLDEAAGAAAALARDIPALVVSVGYSLAPGHPFPAAAFDALLAARWLADHAAEMGVRGGGLGVAGHDAGGHIAASLTFIARDQGGPAISAQALLGPMLDPSMTRAGEAGSGAERAECARCYRAYLPEAAQRLHPYAAPLESRRLGALPPTLIITAQHDLLRPEAERYAARLIDAGVPTEVTRFPNVSHAALATHPPVLAAAADFLRRRLAGAAF